MIVDIRKLGMYLDATEALLCEKYPAATAEVVSVGSDISLTAPMLAGYALALVAEIRRLAEDKKFDQINFRIGDMHAYLFILNIQSREQLREREKKLLLSEHLY